MVVDIYKQKKGGIYYRFKTKKAENIYKKIMLKQLVYKYLSPLEDTQDSSEVNSFIKIGWIVHNEEYNRAKDSGDIIISEN